MANVTKTVKSSGGDYTSLNAALAGQSADLTANCGGTGGAGILTIECYSMSDTTAANTGTGYTTSASYYINITVPTAERHDGKWNTSKYRLLVSQTWAAALTIREAFTNVNYLQINNSGAKDSGPVGILVNINTADATVTIRQNIILASGTGTADGLCIGIEQRSTCNIFCFNNIVYDWGRGFSNGYISGTGCGVTLYNNTIIDCSQRGIYVQGVSGGTYNVVNNLVQGAASNYVLDPDGGLDLSATNLSEDTTSPQSTLREKVVTFVNEAANDFHLASNDTTAIDAGTDLSGTFTTDIDGETRSGTWDIGADEYVAGGVPLSNPFLRPFSQSLGRGGF